MTSQTIDAPRVKPGIAPALAVYAGYLLTFLALGALLHDVDYQDTTASIANLRDAVLVPVGILSVLLAAVTTYFGWWKPVLFERRTLPTWMIAWPVLAVVAMGVNVAIDSEQWDGDFFIWLIVAFALVGFSEELVTRGILLIGARAQRYRELIAWLISTACFAGMHSLNALNGQDIGTTAVQVASTFGTGTLLYFARRVTGTLLVPMLLHMMFDLTLAVHGGPGAELNADTNDPAWAVFVFQLLGAIFLVIAMTRRRTDMNRTNPGAELEPLLPR